MRGQGVRGAGVDPQGHLRCRSRGWRLSSLLPAVATDPDPGLEGRGLCSSALSGPEIARVFLRPRVGGCRGSTGSCKTQLPVLVETVASAVVCTSRWSGQRRGCARSRHPDGILARCGLLRQGFGRSGFPVLHGRVPLMSPRRKRLQLRFNLNAASPSADLDAAFVDLLDHVGHDLAREHLRLVESSDPSDGDPPDSVHRED